jgi:hypothetical protein
VRGLVLSLADYCKKFVLSLADYCKKFVLSLAGFRAFTCRSAYNFLKVKEIIGRKAFIKD